MITDESLDMQESPYFLELARNLKKIRDYFEHPEDFVLELDSTKEEEKNKQRQQLEITLFKDLKKLGREFTELLKERLEKIKTLLNGDNAEQILVKLSDRQKQNQQQAPSDIKQLICTKYPGITTFKDKVLCKTDKGDKKRSEKAKKEDRLYNPIPFHISKEDILELLKYACQALKSSLNSLNRTQLEERVKRNVSFRLMIQRRISSAARLLEQFIQKSSKENEFTSYTYDTIEGIYFQARDARNFQTHDLWREDVERLLNTSCILAYDLPTALEKLLKSDAFKEGSLEHIIIQKVVHNELTPKVLLDAIQKGLNINAYDYKGRTLLHFLAEHKSSKNLGLAQLIIREYGANIHHADFVQMRPLHYTAESGFEKLARFLIEQGAVADIISEQGTPAEIAQQHEHTKLAGFISSKEGNRRLSNARALLDAVDNLDVEKVQNLIQNGYNPGADFKGKLPLVTLFEKEDVDISIQIQIADILLKAGADINQQEPSSGETVIHAAAEYSDHPEIIKFLMRYNPNVNIQDEQSDTPLHKATACRHEKWVKALLNTDADVNIKGFLGYTPLLNACDMNRPSYIIINDLLEHGADVIAESEFGQVIHYAAERGNADIVSLILKYGANPFEKGKGGAIFYNKLPFQIAVDQKIQQLLLSTMRCIFSDVSEEKQKHLRELMGLDFNLLKVQIEPLCPECECNRYLYTLASNDGIMLYCEDCSSIWLNPINTDWNDTANKEILEKKFGKEFNLNFNKGHWSTEEDIKNNILWELVQNSHALLSE